jgi:glycosyltransferase involved in cell wall biosynthesis/peptidoglycan/xylan/chitin deacetylase (PgdA/CDA1 family)
VAVVCPPDEYAPRLVRDQQVRWIPWQIERSSMNPFGNLAAVLSLLRIYRREAPDLVHHFTIKAILYGTLAARRAGVDAIVNSVTGLGHVFLSDRLVAQAVRPCIRRWYTWSLTAEGVRAVFQNRDDLEILAACSPELVQHAVLTRGSGVDLQRFAPPVSSGNGQGPKRVLFAGRLIHEKGIREFVQAAHRCRQQGIDACWVACGGPDPGNPSSVDDDTLRRWQEEGSVQFLGHVECMEAELAKADVVVLPSYREGTPRVLLEAAAMGKPAVATDVPGCREVVEHGENGLLVPPRDATALADAVQQLLADDLLCANLGTAGRQRMEDHFDERDVVTQTLRIYSQMVGPKKETNTVSAERPTGRSGGRIESAVSASRGREPGTDACAAMGSQSPFSAAGVFVFSLDFELAWGTRGRPAATRVGPCLDGTRAAVRKLLSLFEQYQIPATWATVGSLLLGQPAEQGRHAWLSDVAFSDIPAGDAATAPRWYAEDILEWLRDHPADQELACHTLTHRFVDPTPAGREAFRVDLQRFRQLFAERYLTQPVSFIYPKARMAHFDVLVDEGFRCIRGPEDKWFEYLPGTLLPAGFRLLDARLALRPKVRLPWQTTDGLWVLPSSQFYSPLMSVGKRVSIDARVRKAVRGLRQAARQKRLFHLWTHPFNLGTRSDQLLGGIERILQEACRLREAGRLEILTMRDLTMRLDGRGAGSGELARIIHE